MIYFIESIIKLSKDARGNLWRDVWVRREKNNLSKKEDNSIIKQHIFYDNDTNLFNY